MSSEELNGIFAIAGGVVLAVLAFVPAAAVHYRRHGRFSGRDLVALFIVPIYGLALWTYTLLPLPDPDDMVCQTAQLDPWRFVEDLRGAWDGSLRHLLRSSVFLQLALNVIFFVPLGAILRLRYRRGLVWATLCGFVVSLAIETTQLTGVWGIYDCAYRLFDVNDLMTNTAGAVLGSLLALPLATRHVLVDPDRPAPSRPTLGRRIVAMVSDAMVMLAVAAVVGIAWRYWEIDVRGRSVDLRTQAWIQWGAAFAVEAVWVLVLGRSIGESVVQVRTRSRGAAHAAVGRVVKVVSGPGVLTLIMASGVLAVEALAIPFVIAAAIAAVTTRDHRGLFNLLGGLDTEVIPPRGAQLDSAGHGETR